MTLGTLPALATVGLFLASACRAQLGQDFGAPPAAPAAAAPARVYAPPRPFVIGRDNLGFANPAGAIRIAGAAGNCYTMAEVAKLFYELAEYRPGDPAGDGRGFDPAAAAAALEARAYPAVRIPVRGYDSLAALSAVPPGLEFEPWVEDEVRERAGLARRHGEASRVAPPPAHAEALVGLYRLVTTIHYLHYLQYQAGGLVARLAERVLAGEDGVRRTTRSTLEELKHMLPAGELGLLLVFNADPAVSFGHVVLAYRVEETDAHADVFVYDSNVQHGPTPAESVLRVDRATGRYRLLARDATTGSLVEDPRYDGEAWFDAPGTGSLSLLPDARRSAEARRALAAKLRALEATAAYALAVGDLVRDVTGRAPGESPLQADLVRFVRALRAIRLRTGADPGPELPADASAEALCAWLATELEPGLAAALPFVLPAGVGLTGTRILPAGGDRNRLRIETTLVLDPAADPGEVVAGLEAAALGAGDRTLAHLVRAMADAFAGTGVVATLALEVAKEASPDPRLGAFAPRPLLVGSRVAVGGLAPREEPLPAATHALEIAETWIKGAFEKAMRAEKVLGATHTFPLRVDVAGRKVGTDLELTIDKLYPTLDPMDASLVAFVSGTVAGVRFSTPYRDYVSIDLEPTGRRDVFTVRGDSRFYLQVHGAVGWLVDTAASLVEPIFGVLAGALAGRIETFVEDQLARWVVLPSGTRIEFERLQLSSIDEGQKLSAKLRPFEVDLGATVRRFFGAVPPVTLTRVLLEDDRAVLLFDPR